jgi:hypothetical protein
LRGPSVLSPIVIKALMDELTVEDGERS